MGIEVRSLKFDNLLSYETTQPKEEWQEVFVMMDSFLLNEAIYKNGPVFFSVTTDEDDDTHGHFTYYLPINESVDLVADTGFRSLDRFEIKEALVLRQADAELDFTTAYEKTKKYAAEQSIKLEDTYYCVLLKVYDEYIVDLYVPIKKTGR